MRAEAAVYGQGGAKRKTHKHALGTRHQRPVYHVNKQVKKRKSMRLLTNATTHALATTKGPICIKIITNMRLVPDINGVKKKKHFMEI